MSLRSSRSVEAQELARLHHVLQDIRTILMDNGLTVPPESDGDLFPAIGELICQREDAQIRTVHAEERVRELLEALDETYRSMTEAQEQLEDTRQLLDALIERDCRWLDAVARAETATIVEIDGATLVFGEAERQRAQRLVAIRDHLQSPQDERTA